MTPAEDPLDRALDHALRSCARLGAVAVAGVGFVLRARGGRAAVDRLFGRIGAAGDRTAPQQAALAGLAWRAVAGLERLLKRWRW